MRALIGVSDKTGLVELAGGLHACGVELIATGNTARVIAAAGIPVRQVSEVTGAPEMLDGRVKTLHPAIHAGILARRDRPDHLRTLEEHGYLPIDLVVVSLYPFSATVASGADPETVVENIDIGGPTMIRAAAKNSDAVAVLVSPSQYGGVLGELRETGAVSPSTRKRLAAEAFAHVAAYDTAVAGWLARQSPAEGMPHHLTTGGEIIAELRYGENPHQRGALYATPGRPGGVAHARQIQGPGLSFTNWLDADAAVNLVSEFTEPAAAVIKHTNPCGFATADSSLAAYRRAYDCDPRSAYGGIVGLNRQLDLETAQELARTFLEMVICPGIDPDAAARLARRERLRVMVLGASADSAYDVRSLGGGLLVQTRDRVVLDRHTMRMVSERAPTEAEWDDLLVAWRVCRHVKSNAIVIVKERMAVGVGAGQMSRVESAELAVNRAGERVAGAVAASDAFFPMPDGLETLARAGVRAVIHPGGSKNDDAVTAAANALGVSIVLTGERHFRH
ncbi:MAG TPA: bifunctional phosphoribosylaminoimidazolecarboxamide formyltransferase/IMP cyclohydrolase [Candidatus Binatia bacterium]|nr:bifunctional phosphoribosylaminoimidazolecarboxamide formyltransferase/IMP cyclohydrolase [Candidatus Binatia bacterium]